MKKLIKKTMMSSIMFMMLIVTVPFGAFAATTDFPDIKGHWAEDSIKAIVAEGAINGYPDGTFKPNGTITRAEFSNIQALLMGASDGNSAFDDTKGHWGESAINGLVKAKVIDPAEYPNGFDPNGNITRLEMSKMVARGLAEESLLWKGVLVAFKQLKGFKLPFSDQGEMSFADLPYIALANGSGVINGYEDGTFQMNRSATRAEATTMLKRYLDTKNKVPLLNKLLDQFKAEPSVHDKTKAEMEAWIDREADFERLRTHSINTYFPWSLEEANFSFIHPTMNPNASRIEWVEGRKDNMAGFMDVYFNRDYRTIGEEWKKDVRYYYRGAYNHNGVSYRTPEDLMDMFEVFVQEAKDEKRISESIFVTDVSMVHLQEPERLKSQNMVRGTQYIRYTSGTNLPEGIQLNKWYKRDLDVRYFAEAKEVPWEATYDVYHSLHPITEFEEVTE